MFGIGLPELLLIFALALIVLGPDRLPKLGRQIARYMVELKRASEEFKSQLDIESLEKDIKQGTEVRSESGWSDLIDGDLLSERKEGDGSKVSKDDSQTKEQKKD
ncbi:MAG: twin-arginine translocase TatA/TatE family subunit [Deltaproteobacteria bacterium]|nr:twin-arginine translocase TatA/TatE family subunit [Deltaproteobacteria bacterium]MBW1718036.1 twin-arginine translocase TatA/TatE family subunit [Deltaproteobacteria bacterium]MBW1937232.1 twin-arginine translocase TatA/TatE family subunit [Deltaproteobacteria bacterium]MBW1963847.1 twin-arginine translocase TatA/TatE family subunit [Deltaproteobacteria bacterium]MBW2079625.1 twin-arginine translocase TatA/TatE family subunit [Deltaproteobacteria bacterium]